MNRCETCNRPYKGEVYSTEQFKKKFKVGNVIFGFSTGKKIKITAIGDTRFLYTCPDRKDLSESVGTMDSYTSRWREKP